MRKFIFLTLLMGSLASGFAANWRYDSDGCTKIYAYGQDASECFDAKRDILKDAGIKFLCSLGYCF